MTMSITAVPGLVENTMYPLMFDTYDAQPLIFPSISTVHPVTDDKLYGDRGDVLSNVGPPGFVEDGKEIDATEFGEGWTWRVKVGVLKRRLEIPKRMLDAADATARITNLLTSAASAWGEYFANTKEIFVADQYQRGMLTAGDLIFDGSFPNEPDPTPKFIYDGGPWFDDAHVLKANNVLTPSNIDPARALDSDGLTAAITQFRKEQAVDERGQRIRLNPNTLLVPPELQFLAQELLESVLKPGGQDNDKNVLQGLLDLVVNPFLVDDADAWWLLQRGRGYRVYDQGAPQMEQQYEATRQVHHVIAFSGFGANVTNWRYAQSNAKAIA